jgi:hypothetical protein
MRSFSTSNSSEYIHFLVSIFSSELLSNPKSPLRILFKIFASSQHISKEIILQIISQSNRKICENERAMGYKLKTYYNLEKFVKLKIDALRAENILQIREICENERAMSYMLKTFCNLEKSVKMKNR